MKDFKTILYRILGERIKLRRAELGLSQDYLAKEINIGRTSISNIESGKHQVPLSTLYHISKVLDIDIHLILPTFMEIADEVENMKTKDIDEYINKENLNSNQKSDIENIVKNLNV
ncbi:MAG: helix-turn-helix domain-containing protein [Cyclobacteriaceae bacterium]